MDQPEPRTACSSSLTSTMAGSHWKETSGRCQVMRWHRHVVCEH